MIPVTALGHVTFETPDLEHQIAHYTEVVGLTVATREKDRAILATHLGDEAVVLQKGSVQRCIALSLHVDGKTDLAAAGKILGGKGIKSERRSGVTPRLAEALAFDDPNGTRVELFSDKDRLPCIPPAHQAAPNQSSSLDGSTRRVLNEVREDLKTINLKHIRNEGLAKSLREDEVHRSQGGAIR